MSTVEIRKPEVYVRTIELPLPRLSRLRASARLDEAQRQGAELVAGGAKLSHEVRRQVADRASAVDTEGLRRAAGRTAASGAVLAGSAREAVMQAVPVAEEALQGGVRKAAGAVSLAGSTVAQGTRAAAERSKSAANTGLVAVGTAVIQSWRLVFWTSVVGWLLLYILVPDPQRRRQIYQRLAAMAAQP